MYLVVEFLLEKELSIVPVSWTSTDEEGGFTSKWPSHMFPLTLKRVITKMESPDPCWPVYKIRVLYNTVSYRKAEEILDVLDLYTDPELKGITVKLWRKFNKRNQKDAYSELPESLDDICLESTSRLTTESRASPESRSSTESRASPESRPSTESRTCPEPSPSTESGPNYSRHRRFLPSPPIGEAPRKRMLPSPVNFVKIQPNSIDMAQRESTSNDSVKPKRLPSPVEMVSKIKPDLLRSIMCPKTIRQTLSTTQPKTIIKDANTDNLSDKPLMSVITQLTQTIQEQTGLILSLAEIVQAPLRDRSPQLITLTSDRIYSQEFQESVLQETIPKAVMSDWHDEHGTNDDHYRT